MTTEDAKKLRVRVEVIKVYYVTHKDDFFDIHGGPFDTKEDAQQCLKEARESAKHEHVQN